MLRQELASLGKVLRNHAKEDPVCHTLMTMPGVGPVVALTVKAAVDDPERFLSSKDVGPWVGLTPRREQSGERDIVGQVSRAGDIGLRTVLYQAATVMLHRGRKNFPVYDRLFGPYRDRPITFVEIGVLSGGSLFIWRQFFGPTARIIGIDLNPDAVRWREHGFEIHIGSQSDPAFWQTFLNDIGPIDILLDDGGHRFEQQIMTSECVIPGIRDGGLLVVEDAHTSYLPGYGGPSPMSFISYAKQIVDGINHRFGGLRNKYPHESAIWSIRFFESLVTFEIDRRLATQQSRPCRNEGTPVPAKDYRNRDGAVVTANQLISAFRY